MAAWDKVQAPEPMSHINVILVTGDSIEFTASSVGLLFVSSRLLKYGSLYSNGDGNYTLKVIEGVYNVNSVANYMRSVNEQLIKELK